MEEAEALSTKMGIMVKGGVFKCFGSKIHIKNKYGTGYELEIKINTMDDAEVDHWCKQYDPQGALAELSKSMLLEFLKQINFDPTLIDEIKEGGMGTDLWKELQNAHYVSMRSVIKWMFVENNGKKVIEQLLLIFPKVELLEHYNTYYKFRVPKIDKSIGFLFG